MKVLLVAVALWHLSLGASIADVTCPDSCTCQAKDEYLETSCNTYEFIKKLTSKQISSVVRLNINNASLVSIDSKLKYLKNLHSLDLSDNSIATLPSQFPYLPKLKNLDLSNNYLRHVEFAQLPKNLQIVDLSNNLIENFPKDWSSLKELKTLHFGDNPIDCDCSNLLIYERIVQEGVKISENLTCHYPKEFYGQSLESVNCELIKENLLNSMLGDEAGSGLSESETHYENKSAFSDDQEEFINAEGITEHSDDILNNEEGSGDEGSGFIPILPITSPKACHFNCSTPAPIGLHDEKGASPPPDLKEQVAILFNDIVGNEGATTPTPEIKEEPEIVKETDKNVLESPPTHDSHSGEVETFPTNDTVVGEMERASVDGGSNKSIYIIVCLLVAFAVFAIIYVINKRRNRNRRASRKRNKSNENGYGEEMKPLGKSADVVKPVPQINSKLPNAEATPLLNGQNGKINDDGNLKPQPTEDDKIEDVELRKPDKQESLTPQPERVTIKAGELPDSVPKTPLLVHRLVNSDGEIVTTAVNSN